MWIDDINYCILLYTANVFLFIRIYERGADNLPGELQSLGICGGIAHSASKIGFGPRTNKWH